MKKFLSPAVLAHLEKEGAKEIGTDNISPGAEKSEDYDSLHDDAILYLSDDFGKATDIIEERYIGNKLRVVTRSADGMNQYGHRYYLFAVE